MEPGEIGTTWSFSVDPPPSTNGINNTASEFLTIGFNGYITLASFLFHIAATSQRPNATHVSAFDDTRDDACARFTIEPTQFFSPAKQ